MAQISIEQAIKLAREHQQAQRWQQAEVIYRQVLAAVPDHPQALHLLGVVALNTGRSEQAIELIRRAIALQPHDGGAEFHYNLGVALVQGGRAAEAAQAFARAVELRPNMIAARANLAAALMAIHRFDEGIEVCRATLALKPDDPDLWNNLGVALQKTGRLDEAIVAFERSIAIRPESVETLSNLGNMLARRGRFDEAIAAHQRVVSMRPGVPELYNDLGCAFYDAGEYEAAAPVFAQALSLRRNYPEAQCTYAVSLHRSGRLDAGIAAARDAIRLWPDSDLAKFNLAIMLLLRGDFEEGWRLNEARFGVKEANLRRLDFGRPQWDGSDPAGRTIFLYGEQGLGDFIQFIRYIPMVRARGAKIMLGCAPELVRLMKQLDGIEEMKSRGDGTENFQLHCPLLSLPMVFGTNLSNIPAQVPYLRADPDLVGLWRERIEANAECGMRNAESETPNSAFRIPQSTLRVGLIWAGRPTHGDDRNRSIPLSSLAPLAKVPGVWFCSLQKGEAAAQAKSAPSGMKLADFSADIEDFADTAAIMENLDLIISVDTAPAHLAGAIARPTWLLLPYVPDWRWMLDRSDSPWYPTMRLFRQPRLRDWDTAIKEVARALEEFRHS